MDLIPLTNVCFVMFIYKISDWILRINKTFNVIQGLNFFMLPKLKMSSITFSSEIYIFPLFLKA